MIAVIILAAILCAGVCIYILAPVARTNLFSKAAGLVAASALGLYLLLGHPELPPHPVKPNAQAQSDLRQEAGFIEKLQKNPKDADTMIRLAALRLVQNRGNEETLRLLDRAEAIAPGDRRIKVIRSMIANPSPALK